MSQTRRDFLYTSAAALCVTAVATVDSAASPLPLPGVEPAAASPDWIEGDPYLATAGHVGLGGRSWDEAREQFERFRCTAADRDRYVLGVEI